VPALTKETILKTFYNLKLGKKFIFGPEKNGGVYLMGMNQLPKEVFTKVRWGTKYSLQDLKFNAVLSNYLLLEEKEDINQIEDIKNLEKEIQFHCPNLHKLISKKFLQS